MITFLYLLCKEELQVDFNKMKDSDNAYAKALFIVGWGIIVLGVIGSIILATSFGSYDYSGYGGGFNGALFLVGLVSTAVSGTVILGLGEAIRILDDNRRLLAKSIQTEDGIPGDSKTGVYDSQLPEI